MRFGVRYLDVELVDTLCIAECFDFSPFLAGGTCHSPVQIGPAVGLRRCFGWSPFFCVRLFRDPRSQPEAWRKRLDFSALKFGASSTSIINECQNVLDLRPVRSEPVGWVPRVLVAERYRCLD